MGSDSRIALEFSNFDISRCTTNAVSGINLFLWILFLVSNGPFAKLADAYRRKLSGFNRTRRDIGDLESFRWMLSVDRGPGEVCETPFQCVTVAQCNNGICTCLSDLYVYVSPENPRHRECRKKVSYGEVCYLTADCKADDPNTACIDRRCRCVNGAQYISAQRLPSFKRRCYKALESRDSECEIDEQCLQFADHNHRCRCSGICVCYFVRFEQVGIGVVLFIFLLLVIRVTWRKRRYHPHSLEEHNFDPRPSRRSDMHLLNSRHLPSLPAHDVNVRCNHVVSPEHADPGGANVQNFPNMSRPTSYHSLHYIPYGNGSSFESSRNIMDVPPSYDDVIKNEPAEPSDPPPPYQEVTQKCCQSKTP